MTLAPKRSAGEDFGAAIDVVAYHTLRLKTLAPSEALARTSTRCGRARLRERAASGAAAADASGTRCAEVMAMREPVEPVQPGHEVESSLSWRSDDTIRAGARVEGTDGVLGVVRERREAAAKVYLGVDTDDGMIYVPETLVRETAGQTVYLSLPVADARAQSMPMEP